MMNQPCQHRRDAIADLVNGVPSSERSAAIEAHLEECPACRAYRDELRRQDERLAGYFRTMEGTIAQARGRAIEAVGRLRPAKASKVLPVWGAITHNRTIRWGAVAAAVAIVVFGVTTFVPVGSKQRAEEPPWWLSPAAAWGQEILAELEKIRVLTYREQPVFVGRYGSTHVSGSWRRSYEAADRERTDQYYEQTLVSSSWQVPEGADLVRTNVSYEYECYTVEREEGGAYERDPVEHLRFYVRLLNKADRVLGTETFEDRECVGFEISASKYGNNPKHWVDRVWLDVETRMPVRIEKHGRPTTNHPEQTFTEILEQLEYHAEVPAAMFKPVIPDGFVNAHPDQVRAAREAETRSKMEWADVPPEWKRGIVAALDAIETVVYRYNDSKVYLSRHAWRIDHPYEGEPRRTEWFVIEKNDYGKMSYDFNDTGFRLTQTMVNYEDRTYRQEVYDGESRPRHPMDGIRHPVGYIDRADRILEKTVIDGIECFGLELSAKKYGTNPPGMLHRMWFDVETKLPVRMEFEFPHGESGSVPKLVKGRFEWAPDLPPDIFVPVIPEGFVELMNK